MLQKWFRVGFEPLTGCLLLLEWKFPDHRNITLLFRADYFLYFWKIHYNINKIYYVSVYFNLILYKLIDYNDLNFLFSSDILKTKKHQLSKCAHILLIEHAQCKQHVTFIHKILLLLQTFRAPAKSVPEDSFLFLWNTFLIFNVWKKYTFYHKVFVSYF